LFSLPLMWLYSILRTYIWWSHLVSWYNLDYVPLGHTSSMQNMHLNRRWYTLFVFRLNSYKKHMWRILPWWPCLWYLWMVFIIFWKKMSINMVVSFHTNVIVKIFNLSHSCGSIEPMITLWIASLKIKHPKK
jgi:hypothetical protein